MCRQVSRVSVPDGRIEYDECPRLAISQNFARPSVPSIGHSVAWNIRPSVGSGNEPRCAILTSKTIKHQDKADEQRILQLTR
jgi:hypothetical protein